MRDSKTDTDLWNSLLDSVGEGEGVMIWGEKKNRDISLLTKVYIVKAMVFPVVMYGCESWTVKKVEPEELMLLNCGVGEDS